MQPPPGAIGISAPQLQSFRASPGDFTARAQLSTDRPFKFAAPRSDCARATSVLIFNKDKEQPVHLESHATPCGGTPQQRYATLNRAIEQGIDSDDVWSELAIVSSKLCHENEVHRCLRRIRDSARRTKTAKTCFPNAPDKCRAYLPGGEGGAAPDAERESPAADRAQTHSASVGDHLLDAAQYLMHQGMPWLVLTTMLAFPLVVGVGGFLTAGGSPMLLAAIAALPGACVLGVVAAMGREILLTSSNGDEDVPELPPLAQLCRSARSFLVDAHLTLLVFFGAPVLLAFCGAPLQTTLPGLLLACLVAPLAFALRQVRGDLSSFRPLFLLRAVRRAGRGYPAIALASTLAFGPAAVVAVATLGRPIWVQIAIVGPLAVLPMYAVARLLGCWLDTQRESLGYLLVSDKTPPRAQPKAAANEPAAANSRDVRRPRQPSAAAVRNARPSGKATSRPQPASAKARRPRPARSIEGRRPTPGGTPQPPARTGKGVRDIQPDLSSLPGAYVVTGDQRNQTRAASRR